VIESEPNELFTFSFTAAIPEFVKVRDPLAVVEVLDDKLLLQFQLVTVAL
jgi:hypothetical protein